VVWERTSAHILEGTGVTTYIDWHFVAYLNAHYTPLESVNLFYNLYKVT
jgi:hypothetical protein